jgi:hypothetical protein
MTVAALHRTFPHASRTALYLHGMGPALITLEGRIAIGVAVDAAGVQKYRQSREKRLG